MSETLIGVSGRSHDLRRDRCLRKVRLKQSGQIRESQASLFRPTGPATTQKKENL